MFSFGFCDKTITKHFTGDGYFVEEKMTYADIGVFHIMRANEEYMPGGWERTPIPKLKAFQTRIAAFEPIAEYLASDRQKPWEGNSLN